MEPETSNRDAASSSMFATFLTTMVEAILAARPEGVGIAACQAFHRYVDVHIPGLRRSTRDATAMTTSGVEHVRSATQLTRVMNSIWTWYPDKEEAQRKKGHLVLQLSSARVPPPANPPADWRPMGTLSLVLLRPLSAALTSSWSIAEVPMACSAPAFVFSQLTE